MPLARQGSRKVSLTRQCQIRCHSGRSLLSAIRHEDLEPVRAQADDPHIGRHATIDRVGPIDEDMDCRPLQLAGQSGRPDPTFEPI